MARHKRYSKRKSQRRNRRYSRKMVGGVDTPPMPLLNISDLNVSGQSNISDQTNNSGNGLQNWENSGFSGDTTINSNDWSIGQQNLQQPGQQPGQQAQPDFGDIEPINPIEGENNYLDDDDDDELSLTADQSANTTKDGSFSIGGKRKSKKRSTNKRKSRKTRKSRKSRQRGGGSGFTTSLTTNPIAYEEDEYDQFKNALNYKPSKQ
jgi:hypothetical protein